METGYLGFCDPASYSWTTGSFGVYHSHGGDWFHGAGELHSAAMAFPIVVEASLLINSDFGAPLYQCRILRDAFDNAWVPN
jgi:hypothetical protein